MNDANCLGQVDKYNSSVLSVLNRFKNFIAEIIYCVLLTGAACLFSASASVTVTFIAVAMVVLSINMLAKSTCEYLNSRLLNSYLSSDKGFKKNVMVVVCQICKTVASFNLALLYGVTGGVLVHEGGHFAAVSLVFQHGYASVTMEGLLEASTDWTIGKYTAIGTWLGPLKAGLFTAAAGALAAVCFATIGIVLSLRLEKKYPKLSSCIFFASVFSILTQINYALSAFFTDPDDLGHDFMHLWQGGIHPFVSIACLIAIPAIAVFAYLRYRGLRIRRV